MQLSIQTIADVCKGKILYSGEATDIITSVCIDTRKITPGALFFAFKGENHDGHDFIKEAAQKGAVCAISEGNDMTDINIPLIQVASSAQAIMDLAAYYRCLHDVKVIAVAGSAGKTSTKEMIAAISSQRFKTKKTMGNYNNHIGLPLSIFQLTPDDEVLILEMGMNRPNEITPLSKISKPDIAVITIIDDEHMENFANREEILHANLEIIDGLSPTGVLVLNGDDPLLTHEITKQKTQDLTVLYPSLSNIIETQPNGLTSTHCVFSINNQTLQITVPLPGAHMVKNALLAATVGLSMGLTPQEITDGIAALDLPDGRLDVLQANGMTIINDCYNANPVSMQEAIKVLLLAPPQNEEELQQNNPRPRRVCILGDMRELGHVSEDRHRELGIYVAQSNVDLLISIGEMSRLTHDSYLTATNRVFSALHFPTTAAFLTQWESLLFLGDIVLIKASRGMAFETIVTAITEEKI